MCGKRRYAQSRPQSKGPSSCGDRQFAHKGAIIVKVNCLALEPVVSITSPACDILDSQAQGKIVIMWPKARVHM